MVVMDIMIPKGTVVMTTHPSGERISKRKQVVSCMISGFDKRITWAGTSSYWRWVKVEDVIDANPDLKAYLDNNMVDEIKNQIKKILWGTKRDVARLVNYLENDTDFFEAPASTKHHLARVGGLAEHSLSVYETMVRLNDMFELDIPSHHIAITGLLHDLCKTSYYVREVEPVPGRSEFGRYTGEWVVEDKLPLGHGEKSLYLVSKYLTLSDAEAAAIRFHEGCWVAGVTTDSILSKAYNNAINKYPLVSLLVAADFLSARLLEE